MREAIAFWVVALSWRGPDPIRFSFENLKAKLKAREASASPSAMPSAPFVMPTRL